MIRTLFSGDSFPPVVAFCLLVICISCAPIGGSGNPPAPVDPVPPSGNAVEAAAAEYVRAYAIGLATAADECAAGSYSDYDAAFKAWDLAARTVREREIQRLNQVINDAHKSDFETWSPDVWKRVMGELADGCRGAKR